MPNVSQPTNDVATPLEIVEVRPGVRLRLKAAAAASHAAWVAGNQPEPVGDEPASEEAEVIVGASLEEPTKRKAAPRPRKK